MDGEFTCEEAFGTVKGVAGGNIILLGTDPAGALEAAEAAAAAMRTVEGVILPFPGGIARSGSKVGSKYKALRASTNTAYRADPSRPGRRATCRTRSAARTRSSSTA